MKNNKNMIKSKNNKKHRYNNKKPNKRKRIVSLLKCIEPVNIHASRDLIDETIDAWKLDTTDLNSSTQRQYAGKILAFERFCLENQFKIQPMSQMALQKYCEWRADQAAYSTISLELKIFRKAHVICSLESPVDDPDFKAFRKSFKKRMDIAAEEAKASMTIVGSQANIVMRGGQNKLIDLDKVIDSALVEDARKFIVEHSISHNTQKAYQIQLNHFYNYCNKLDLDPMVVLQSKNDLMNYLTWFASQGYSPDTLSITKAALRFLAGIQDLPDVTSMPSFSKFFKGLKNEAEKTRRKKRKQKSHKKKALLGSEVMAICDILNERISQRAPGWEKDLMDKTMLLIGFTGAMRGSEYTSRDRHEAEDDLFFFLDRRHIIFHEKGLIIKLDRSKTNQNFKKENVYIQFASNEEYCAVTTMAQWLDLVDERAGLVPEAALKAETWDEWGFYPVFPGGGRRYVKFTSRMPICSATPRRMIKRLVPLIGLDPDEYGSHSNRSGHVTTADMQGATTLSIATQGRWRNLSTILIYVDEEKSKDTASSGKLGL